jgi:RNA polymerase sigma factor (sigma-70 family)
VPLFKKLNDEQLVIAIKNGDKQALMQLYRDNMVSVRNYILKNNGREEDADDVIQDACIAVWEKIQNNQLILNAKLSTFVFAVSKNIWLKKLNKSSRQVELSDIHTEKLSENADIFNQQDLSLVSKALEMLGEKCKTILQLFYFEGKDMIEIAEILEYNNADTAKAKKHQCFKNLREQFLKTYDKSDFWEN